MAQMFFSISEPELKNLLRETVLEVITENLPNQQPKQGIELLTRQDVSELLGVSLVTLNQWTKDGQIKAHRIGSRVRYRIEDVEDALQEIRVHKRRGA